MQQLTIRMPEEYFAKIEKIAETTGLRKSDITRIALKKYLEEYSPTENTNLFKKAQRLIGVVESGVPDLGKNHRRHLIEKIKGRN